MTHEIYREHILELFKSPHNFGELKKKTHSHFQDNPLCGDEMKIDLIIDRNKVKDVKFSGKGCAISMASASLLTDKIKDLSINEIKKLNENDILQMLMIPVGPTRIKCALLPLDAINKALDK